MWLGECDSVESEKEISTLKLASWEVLWKSFVTVGGSEGSSVWGILFARVLFFFQFD